MRSWESQIPKKEKDEDSCSVVVPELLAPIAAELGRLAWLAKLGLRTLGPHLGGFLMETESSGTAL